MIGVHVKQKWVYMNPSGMKLLGARSEGELLGRDIQEIISLEFRDLVRSRVEQVQEKGLSSPEIEQQFIRLDGAKVDVSVSSVPIDYQGESGILMFAEDISARKKAEEELRRSHDELERSNAELQQFAYVASHDLQEPLRMVSSYMGLIERRYKGRLDADADDFIGYAIDGAKRMRMLINDLLEYSRVGTHGKAFGPVDCETLLSRVLDHLQLSIEDSGATVTHDHLPVVIGDSAQLLRLFQNLIHNSLKFKNDSPPLIHVSAEQSYGNWLFSFHDNGIGIDPQYADRIFVIFQRLHNRDEYPGTGIGLAICKKIVETTWRTHLVSIRAGQGSHLLFHNPQTGFRILKHEAEMLEDRLTILLIEDNPVDTRLIKEMCLDCETIDLDIQCESRLALGLARLGKGGVSGVFLDLNLPDSLGIETLTRVDTEFPEIPIIVLTGQEDEAMAVEAVKQGAQDYLVKGLVDGKQLVRSIQYALERKRMAVDLTRARDELEKRVEERTAELTRSNRKLEKQITERKLAAEELKQSEERFRAIFDGANDFIFIKDLSLRYTHINPATAKLFGVPASEMLGKTAEDILKKEAAQYIREADTRVLKGESIEEITTREIMGVPMTFHEVRVPMHNGSGEIIGVCGISRDITDLNRLQDTQKFVSQEYRSEIMKAVLKQAAFAASTKSVVLLLGESGVGKDYLAKYIHKRSNYSSGSYYSINCAAVPLELAESELFGHEAGAFTGAVRRKRGLLELAEGGTLLLNEVGELSPALQAKLLTFLDTRTFTRVGGQQNIRVNARILAATNRDLQHEISIGRFRADLYYRLNVFSIRVPPLRNVSKIFRSLLQSCFPSWPKTCR